MGRGEMRPTSGKQAKGKGFVTFGKLLEAGGSHHLGFEADAIGYLCHGPDLGSLHVAVTTGVTASKEGEWVVPSSSSFLSLSNSLSSERKVGRQQVRNARPKNRDP